MKVVFSAAQLAHGPPHFLSSGREQPNPEVPERAERLLAAAQAAGLEQVEPPDLGRAPLASVHSPEYLAFLENIYRRWQYIPDASASVMPNVHPDRRDRAYPKSAVGQVGYHVYDGSCPVSADTWDSARFSAYSAAHAASIVADGDTACYALCRPPGHHAGRDLVGGFCYFNNAAVAAERLCTQFDRVAILDVDVHHGNGTQDVFWRRDDVLTVSIHADPLRFYPFFWGHAHERGAGRGLGYNLNLPLPRGTSDEDYLLALDAAIGRVRAFAPGALVVALGLDAHESDPFEGFAVTTDGFARIASKIAALDLPTVLVQEGGYLSEHLAANLESFLHGFERHR